MTPHQYKNINNVVNSSDNMPIVYMNNDEYYRMLEISKKDGKRFSDVMYEELHKKPEIKEVPKEVFKDREVIKEVPTIDAETKKYIKSLEIDNGKLRSENDKAYNLLKKVNKKE